MCEFRKIKVCNINAAFFVYLTSFHPTNLKLTPESFEQRAQKRVMFAWEKIPEVP